MSDKHSLIFVATGVAVPCRECANYHRHDGCKDQEAKCGSSYPNSQRKRDDRQIGVFKREFSIECLFVGGTHDGELILADLNIVHLRLKKEPVYTTSKELVQPTMETEEYHRIEAGVPFYAISTLAPAQAMRQLIACYKKPNKKEHEHD